MSDERDKISSSCRDCGHAIIDEGRPWCGHHKSYIPANYTGCAMHTAGLIKGCKECRFMTGPKVSYYDGHCTKRNLPFNRSDRACEMFEPETQS